MRYTFDDAVYDLKLAQNKYDKLDKPNYYGGLRKDDGNPILCVNKYMFAYGACIMATIEENTLFFICKETGNNVDELTDNQKSIFRDAVDILYTT